MWTLQYKGFYCPLSFTFVITVKTIYYALYHCKFSYMITHKFMKLCTLQGPNMKMCTLVGYPGPFEFYPCYASLDLEILKQFTVHFVITTPLTCLNTCLWNLVYWKITIWKCDISSISRSNEFSQSYARLD